MHLLIRLLIIKDLYVNKILRVFRSRAPSGPQLWMFGFGSVHSFKWAQLRRALHVLTLWVGLTLHAILLNSLRSDTRKTLARCALEPFPEKWFLTLKFVKINLVRRKFWEQITIFEVIYEPFELKIQKWAFLHQKDWPNSS